MNNKNLYNNIGNEITEKLIQMDLADLAEKSLITLYKLEKLTNYEDKKISQCINILQEWKPKK